ncbi:MAG: molybdate ABC transporter permease subunit [Alcaligenaceae bacterium]|jgi:molybdate transport system permease protein|nr:molybdate ABC transporter permease subunit [Alcaligenaceae bacterium]
METAIVPLMLSLQVAFWATLVNAILGVALGWWLAQKSTKFREFIDVVATLPMVLPPTVLGYYLLVLFGSRTGLDNWLFDTFGFRMIFSINGAIIASIVATFPLVFRPARAAFEAVNIEYSQVSWVLGVSKVSTFFRIVLPLAWRGVLAGLLLGFVRCMGEFGATLMVAGSIPGRTQTLSIAIYEAVQAGRDTEVTQLVMLISAVCVAVLLLSNYLSPRKPS